MILQNGERWRRVRRVTTQAMRDFGVGKRSIEERIQEELHHVIKTGDDTNEQGFEFGDTFNRAVLNVICSVLFGKR